MDPTQTAMLKIYKVPITEQVRTYLNNLRFVQNKKTDA